MRFLYPFLLCVLAADLAVSLTHVDRWRSLFLMLAFVCAVLVRDDMTKASR